MAIYRTYIQQISFDGQAYTKGTPVDLLARFNIMSMEFPFRRYTKPKALATRDWAGKHGVDVYVPEGALPMSSYEIDVTFLYVGTEDSIRGDLAAFLDFITGKAKAAGSDTANSGRLAIYDEHVGFGRKDVAVNEISDEIFYCSDEDPDAVAKFGVKFTVYDPVTDVSPTIRAGQITDLSW
jgi:hypothetical protein